MRYKLAEISGHNAPVEINSQAVINTVVGAGKVNSLTKPDLETICHRIKSPRSPNTEI